MRSRLRRRDFLALCAAAALAPADALAESLAPRFRTEPALDPPIVHVLTTGSGASSRLVFVTCTNGAGQPGPLIVDEDGVLVWFRPREGLAVMNFAPHVLGDEPVLAWWEGTLQGGHGAGEVVLVGGDYTELTRVRAGNGLSADLHEFSITPEGTAILTAYDTIDSTVGPLLDSLVQEVDVATGAVVHEWRASDHIAFDESYLTPSGKGPFDFAHLNSAALDDDGHLLISSRHTWTIYKVDRSSGDVIWRLGGKRSDFRIGEGADFAWQHHVRRHPDGSVTIFDNGAGPVDTEPYSRGLRLAVDETAGTATLLQAAVHPDHLLASAMGSVEIDADGGLFVGWGAVPRFSDFAPDGTLRFDAAFPAGGFSYRAFQREWTGIPLDRPKLALASEGGARVAYASWNGATGIAAWRLRAGATPGGLRREASVERRAFEARLRIPGGAAWVAADALDARGNVLGSSRLVRV